MAPPGNINDLLAACVFDAADLMPVVAQDAGGSELEAERPGMTPRPQTLFCKVLKGGFHPLADAP